MKHKNKFYQEKQLDDKDAEKATVVEKEKTPEKIMAREKTPEKVTVKEKTPEKPVFTKFPKQKCNNLLEKEDPPAAKVEPESIPENPAAIMAAVFSNILFLSMPFDHRQ